MKLPKVRKFKKVLFCNTHREDCSTIDKTKVKCKNNCKQCINSEEIYQRRFT
jgi:hypothetical protein